jgi:hypothetical protein
VLGVVLAVVVVCGAVVALGVIARVLKDDGGGTTPAAGQNTSAAAPAVDPSIQRSNEAAAGIPPVPDAATQAAYIRDLKAINPAIVGRHSNDTMIGRGRNQCSSIKQYPNDRVKLIDLTNKRFTAPDYPNGFGAATAAKILDVVHKRICPSYPMVTA